MKILICKDYLSMGGMTTYIMHLAEALNKNNEVHLICTHYKGNFYDQAKAEFHEAYAWDKDLKFFTRCIKIFKKIKALNPDVIFINHAPLINMLLPFLPKHIKIISVIHSDDPKYYIQGSFYKPWIDQFICPAPKLKKELNKKYKVSEKNILVIPHGVKSPKSISQKIRNSIVFIGNIDLHKGCDMLIPCFQEIHKEEPSATLTIVGDGPKTKLLKEQIKGLPDLTDKVKLIPKLSHNEVYSLLSKMEILFFPTKLESFGYVIPEAMINGVIPVVSKLEGITDQFITDGKNGFLCNPDEPKCFFQKISAVLMREDKSNLSSDARIQIENNFSMLQFSGRYNTVVSTIKKTNKINFLSGVVFFMLNTTRVICFKFLNKLKL